MINMHSQYPYIIKLTVNKKHRQYDAILRTMIDTSMLLKSDGKNIQFSSYSAVVNQLSIIYEVLQTIEYKKRNTITQLNNGYNIVGMFAGQDYCSDPMGYYDRIEVRSIHSNQVAITYEIAEDTPQKN